MSDICVKVKDVRKRFRIYRSKKTTFRAIKSIIQLKPIRETIETLHGISFEVKRGEKMAIIGKNGSGKTTLLRLIAGIYEKTSGYVEVNDAPAVLFQCIHGLNRELSVTNNIFLFGAIHGISKEVIEENLETILEISGLKHIRYSLLSELSMGQKQRLAMSVFSFNTKKFLMIDESFAHIDQEFEHYCDDFFKRVSESDKTAIIVSHDPNILRKYCQSAIWIEGGYVKDLGPVSEILEKYEKSLGL